MRKKLSWVTILCALLTSGLARADLIYDDGETHVVDFVVNDTVGIFNGPGATTVIFRDGANITGTDPFDDTVYVEDSSIAVIEGGTFINDVSAYGEAELIISGGQFNDDIFAIGEARVEISGGNVVDDVEIQGDTTLQITGGTFGEDIEVFGGTADIYGGTFAANGVAFQDTGFGVGDGGLITLYGSNFRINGVAVGGGVITDISGTLSGTLSDGTDFTGINFTRSLGETGSFGGMFLATPEPSSASLVAMLVSLLIQRRRRRA